jgi:3-keto-5-aminohexanoate cleavage enzyme
MTNLTWRYADSFAFMEHTRAGFPPAMICVAVNGGIQGKETHPARPETEVDACIPFTYGIVEQFAAEMKKRGIKPEIETYHTGGAWVIRDLIEKGLVEPPYLVQTVMGAQTASYPTPGNVLKLLEELPEQTVWLCSGIGPFQLPLTTLALMMGGHARVGLEDNLYYSRGRKFTDNAESVKRVVRLAGELNRPIATPSQTRQLLGLPERSGSRPSA